MNDIALAFNGWEAPRLAPRQEEFQFYPTPFTVVMKLCGPYMYQEGRFLEPSAGRGDIADVLLGDQKPYTASAKRDVSVCEISSDLRAILADKGHKIIGTDFLKMVAPYLFDFIIMNPPFRYVSEHVLKAWDMLEYDGELAAIVPKIVLKKDVALFAKLRQLIEIYGTVEELGEAFAHADRTTYVDCIIIRLKKSEEAPFNPFEDFTPKMDADYEAPERKYSPAPLDIIAALVRQYNAAMKALKVATDAEWHYRSLVSGMMTHKTGESYIARIDRTKEAFWNQIFDRTKIGEAATSAYRQKFMAERAKLSKMEFSEETIYEVWNRFVDNRYAIMDECIMDTFNKLIEFSRDNVVESLRWATNKGWKINPKVIIPNMVYYDKFNSWNYSSRNQNFLDDLDKCLMMFGGQHGVCTYKAIVAIVGTFGNYGNKGVDYQQNFETPNFTIRCHKKGTLHLWFKDAKALEMLNKHAADHHMFDLGTGK